MIEYKTDHELVAAIRETNDVEGKEHRRFTLSKTSEHKHIVRDVVRQYAEYFPGAEVIFVGTNSSELKEFFEPFKDLEWMSGTNFSHKGLRINLGNDSHIFGAVLNHASSFCGRKNANLLFVVLDREKISGEHLCSISGMLAGTNSYVILFTEESS